MNSIILSALAEPNRLRIVERLRERPYAVNEIAERLHMRQPQVSKHLRILSEAGLVTVYPVAQQRFYGLVPDAFREVNTWLQRFKPFWDISSNMQDNYLVTIREKRPLPAKNRPFKLERLFPYSPAEIWEAWTDPDLVRQWYAPDYFAIPVCELDVQPGGTIRIDMQAPDGTILLMSGMYQEVVRPLSLVYRGSLLDEKREPFFDILTIAHFHAQADDTLVTVESRVMSTGHNPVEYLASLEPGWNQTFFKLERLLGIRKRSKAKKAVS